VRATRPLTVPKLAIGKRKKPLMQCSEKQARLLLTRRRAVCIVATPSRFD
jgi:hypothetical protein